MGFKESDVHNLDNTNVVPSPKSPSVGDDFDHLIAYSMACTLENHVQQRAMGHEGFKFVSLHKMIKERK